MTELSKKIGLDGLALCAAKEDFTLINELNIDMSEYRVPWFENIRGRELKQLFGEHNDLQFNKKKRGNKDYAEILSDNETSGSKSSSTEKNQFLVNSNAPSKLKSLPTSE